MTTETETLTLSDGRLARLREAKGRDLIAATRLTDDTNALALALAAQVLTVAGEPVLYEELLDWPLRDVVAVQTAIAAQMGALPTPAPGR